MTDYHVWLKLHNEVINEAKSTIKKYGFESIIIKNDRSQSFIRIKFGSKKIDFYVKPIKTNYVHNVWLCKKDKFNAKVFYLLYSIKEKMFYVASGNDIYNNHNIKESEYDKDIKYLVVPFSTFRSAKNFFKRMKTRYEGEIQRRINTWF